MLNEVFAYRWERGVDSRIVLENWFGNARLGIEDILSEIYILTMKEKEKLAKWMNRPL